MADLLRLAIQKSGRLFEGTDALLKECDIEFNSGKSTLKAQAANFPVEFYFLRDDDKKIILRCRFSAKTTWAEQPPSSNAFAKTCEAFRCREFWFQRSG